MIASSFQTTLPELAESTSQYYEPQQAPAFIITGFVISCVLMLGTMFFYYKHKDEYSLGRILCSFTVSAFAVGILAITIESEPTPAHKEIIGDSRNNTVYIKDSLISGDEQPAITDTMSIANSIHKKLGLKPNQHPTCFNATPLKQLHGGYKQSGVCYIVNTDTNTTETHKIVFAVHPNDTNGDEKAPKHKVEYIIEPTWNNSVKGEEEAIGAVDSIKGNLPTNSALRKEFNAVEEPQ